MADTPISTLPMGGADIRSGASFVTKVIRYAGIGFILKTLGWIGDKAKGDLSDKTSHFQAYMNWYNQHADNINKSLKVIGFDKTLIAYENNDNMAKFFNKDGSVKYMSEGNFKKDGIGTASAFFNSIKYIENLAQTSRPDDALGYSQLGSILRKCASDLAEMRQASNAIQQCYLGEAVTTYNLSKRERSRWDADRRGFAGNVFEETKRILFEKPKFFFYDAILNLNLNPTHTKPVGYKFGLFADYTLLSSRSFFKDPLGKVGDIIAGTGRWISNEFVTQNNTNQRAALGRAGCSSASAKMYPIIVNRYTNDLKAIMDDFRKFAREEIRNYVINRKIHGVDGKGDYVGEKGWDKVTDYRYKYPGGISAVGILNSFKRHLIDLYNRENVGSGFEASPWIIDTITVGILEGQFNGILKKIEIANKFVDSDNVSTMNVSKGGNFLNIPKFKNFKAGLEHYTGIPSLLEVAMFKVKQHFTAVNSNQKFLENPDETLGEPLESGFGADLSKGVIEFKDSTERMHRVFTASRVFKLNVKKESEITKEKYYIQGEKLTLDGEAISSADNSYKVNHGIPLSKGTTSNVTGSIKIPTYKIRPLLLVISQFFGLHFMMNSTAPRDMAAFTVNTPATIVKTISNVAGITISQFSKKGSELENNMLIQSNTWNNGKAELSDIIAAANVFPKSDYGKKATEAMNMEHAEKNGSVFGFFTKRFSGWIPYHRTYKPKEDFSFTPSVLLDYTKSYIPGYSLKLETAEKGLESHLRNDGSILNIVSSTWNYITGNSEKIDNKLGVNAETRLNTLQKLEQQEAEEANKNKQQKAQAAQNASDSARKAAINNSGAATEKSTRGTEQQIDDLLKKSQNGDLNIDDLDINNLVPNGENKKQNKKTNNKQSKPNDTAPNERTFDDYDPPKKPAPKESTSKVGGGNTETYAVVGVKGAVIGATPGTAGTFSNTFLIQSLIVEQNPSLNA